MLKKTLAILGLIPLAGFGFAVGYVTANVVISVPIGIAAGFAYGALILGPVLADEF